MPEMRFFDYLRSFIFRILPVSNTPDPLGGTKKLFAAWQLGNFLFSHPSAIYDDPADKSFCYIPEDAYLFIVCIYLTLIL